MSTTTLHEVDIASFVGLNIDKHLTWKPHIETVNKSIRKKIGIIYRLRNCVPQRILILLYKTLVQPHITYGIEVWGSTYETNLKCILLSQKMALRGITFSSIRTHSKPLFKKLQLLNVYLQLHKLCIGAVSTSFTEALVY